ncbi:MAG: hypothetical protein ACJ8FY_14875 [Gemmataceae bacterium]
MTVALSMQFPGSRVLAGWWRRLAPLNPVGLWIGSFLFHDVAATVQTTRPAGLSRFAHLIVQGLDIAQEKTVSGLSNLLLLDEHAVLQVLSGFERDGLVEADTSGIRRLTLKGKRALQEGTYPTSPLERRLFTFIQTSEKKSPAYVLLQNGVAFKSPSSLPSRFEVAWLTECLNQTPEWKKRRQFPQDVVQLLRPSHREEISSLQQPIVPVTNAFNSQGIPTPAAQIRSALLEDWQCIILTHAWRQTVAIVLTQDAGLKEALLAFPVEGPQWDLDAKRPLFTILEGWREIFDELTADPPQEAWARAWQDWCQPRGLPFNETSHGIVGKVGHKLHVTASRRMMDQLRSQRSDALKGEAWLLAGTGDLRTAGLLEIVEKSSAR